MPSYHLAQINIARVLAPLDTKLMQGFVARLDEINALAEKSPGFIWRLVTEDEHDTSLQAFKDPALVVNLTVWKDLQSVQAFVYQSAHLELLRSKSEWFSKIQNAHQALWWLPAKNIPTIKQGKEKLDYLQKNGPSNLAFTFANPFETEF